ncbi:MAG: hypothetical protein QOD06_2901 [Candidatus Binatota bacterium]|nr:hypothetical protein [Candidatus Binatota bacterium]
MKLQKDLREFFELLNSRAVDYLVVGGHAVTFHGYPRYTGLWIRVSSENASRVLESLDAFGFAGTGLTADDFLRAGRVIQLGTPPNRIDLLTGVTGVDFDEAWESRIQALLDDVPVAFVARDVLLRNKRATGRAKGVADVEQLTRTRSR